MRIDVQTSTPGIEFASAWARKIEREVSGTRYWLLSKNDLIATKRAAGRPRDLEDVRVLESDQR